MATIAAAQAFYLGNRDGLPPVMVGGIGIPGNIYKEAASQSFAAAAPVRPDATSGKIEIQPDGDNVTGLFGIAMQAASGDTDTPVLIRKFRPGDWYVMNLEASGAQTSTPDLDDIGDAVEFNIASGLLFCDQNGVGGNDSPLGVIIAIHCKEMGYDTSQLLGDTFGRVVVELQPGHFWGRSV